MKKRGPGRPKKPKEELKITRGFRLLPMFYDALERASLRSGDTKASIVERALREHLGIKN